MTQAICDVILKLDYFLLNLHNDNNIESFQNQLIGLKFYIWV